MVKQISDNEIYLLIKYIKNILWRVSKYLSNIEEAGCLKVKYLSTCFTIVFQIVLSPKNIFFKLYLVAKIIKFL